MFAVGETVLYGSDGVCEISDITEKAFGESKALYYILTPVFNNRSKVFVPISNEKLVNKMCPVLSIEEIRNIIDDDSSDILWVDNDSKRGELFKSILSEGDFGRILHMAKCIGMHRSEIEQMGKKLHKSDEMIYKDSIKIVYEELAMSIELSKEDVESIICKKISIV